MEIYPEFPTHRLDALDRRGELAVYRALEAADVNGIALYEARAAGKWTSPSGSWTAPGSPWR